MQRGTPTRADSSVNTGVVEALLTFQYDAPMNKDIPDDIGHRHVYSVSDLNQTVKRLLETEYRAVWVEAEISNLVQPRSGHIYLSLKDDGAQLRAAMFRGNNVRLPFKPKDGMQVLVRGRLSLYAPRGDYQMIIDHMEEAGLGALQRTFEQLKSKLQQEGLFNDDRKQAIALHPTRIGVVTSATGAAIRDILSVLKRRSPITEVILYPTLVQGDQAAAAICQAIETANRRNECDVLIVGRGGGSLEDLWCFNDESVARAIAASELPVVSAVGHQVDFTIADFVADVRAPTPSAAAELLSTDCSKLMESLNAYELRLKEKIKRHLQFKQQSLDWASRQLKHPGKRLQEHAQRLDQLDLRLRHTISQRLRLQQSEFERVRAQLLAQTPTHQIKSLRKDVLSLSQALVKGMQQQLKQSQNQSANLAQRLNSVSPLNTLGRGYSITKSTEGKVISDARRVSPGDKIISQLQHGALICQVEKTELTD